MFCVARLFPKNLPNWQKTGAMAFEIDRQSGKKDVAKAIKAIYNVTPEKN